MSKTPFIYFGLTFSSLRDLVSSASGHSTGSLRKGNDTFRPGHLPHSMKSCLNKYKVWYRSLAYSLGSH